MLKLAEGIEDYVLTHTSREDSVLHELWAYTQANCPLPQMQTGHVEGTLLRLLVQAIGARLVLEIGTYTGYSALSMAMGLPDGGKVTTCDVDEEITEVARRFWGRSDYGQRIELRIGPALETIESLAGPLDLVFIDADKTNYINYWEAIVPIVRPGGLIVADNVLWSGRVLDPKEPDDHAIVAFNEHVRYDGRIESVMLTVRDGITVARKRT